MRQGPSNRRIIILAAFFIATGAFSASLARAGALPATIHDFFFGGSQPTSGVVYEPFLTSVTCKQCHEVDKFDNNRPLVIYPKWQGSMMAQAGRDPLFHACLAIANQDAAESGDMCLRCHAAAGWVQGRSVPTDGSNLNAADRDGVSCSICHRMVDPVLRPNSPVTDAGILNNIATLPVNPGNGAFVLDPADLRRGPYDNSAPSGHLWTSSPFLRSAALCGTCHDVSNPVYQRQPDGTYALTELDEPHPTGDQYDMFPIERTYSEWLNSAYAAGPIDSGGRFGGNNPLVSTCQDCHMPKVADEGCTHPLAPVRTDLASHDFSGGNAWVQDMILNLYPDDGLIPANFADAKARAVSMLQRASTLDVAQHGNHLAVRITNETGHKLPTGYPEGRRMWINVQLFDAAESPVAEFGAYDNATAELTIHDTKIYEAHLGVDELVSAATGVPVGESFHFALNNVILKDNRIPPRGFTNANFQTISARPVEAYYIDGQHWDDTRFRLPSAATSATVNVYYQTASKDYITFLRDENRTNDAGDVLYEQWEMTGKSPPVLMATHTIAIQLFADGDYNGDTFIDLYDYAGYWNCPSGPGQPYPAPDCAALDFDADGDLDLPDFGEWQRLLPPS
ncbi:MAG: hypothetical protein HOP29_20205 [Phycisphaerales bacterium]|nr:hypothetical protein [Phycisphaerales bacterium]